MNLKNPTVEDKQAANDHWFIFFYGNICERMWNNLGIQELSFWIELVDYYYNLQIRQLF